MSSAFQNLVFLIITSESLDNCEGPFPPLYAHSSRHLRPICPNDEASIVPMFPPFFSQCTSESFFHLE